MPVYEYFCPTCKAKFEKLRPIRTTDDAVRCTEGHEGARRLVSVFAMGGRTDELVPASAGGGCCGGGCACGAS